VRFLCHSTAFLLVFVCRLQWLICQKVIGLSTKKNQPDRIFNAEKYNRWYFGAYCTNLNEDIDPYIQRQKCRPMTLVSGNIRYMYMRIFAGVPLGGDLKWEWGCWRRQFLAIWVATSSETSEIRPAVLYDDMLPLVDLWLIAKWMT